MINRNTMLIENHRFLTELRGNKGRYLDFLGTMAKYHKYNLMQQVNLFFHAPSAATAVAPLEVWQKLGHPVREHARAIPILTGERNRETISYVYDMRDTEGYQEGQTVLWKLDENADLPYLEQCFPGDETAGIQERVLSKCRQLAEGSPVENPELVALSTAYVVLTRMGYDTDAVVGLPLLQLPWQDIHPDEALAAVNQFSQQLLNPIGKYIRDKEREHHEQQDEHRRGNEVLRGDGVHPSPLSEGSEAGIVEGTGGERGSSSVSGTVRGGVFGEVQPDGEPDAGEGRDSGASGTGDGLVHVDDPLHPDPRAGEGDSFGGDSVVTEGSQDGTQETQPESSNAIDWSAIDYEADLSSVSGKRKVFQRNLAAIRVMKQLEAEDRSATPEEQRLLKSYAGFGGLPEAFDEFNTSWKKEYQALRAELSDSEFTSARGSVLNAHFTSPMLVQQIYSALEKMGFQQGNILEPAAGSGRFFDSMPDDMRKNSHVFGVELDDLTSRITAKAYPDVTMSNQGFETTSFLNGSFDLAISNVPFGNYQVASDLSHRADNFLIHDYFLAKMLDDVRPGGLVVAMTSKGTMDKKAARVREYLARRAELVTAIRLPNTAFQEAGTSATTDILILKKREQVLDKDVELPTWAHRFTSSYNLYWDEHPEAVMGTLKHETGPFGPELTCVPNPNMPLEQQLQTFIQSIPQVYQPADVPLPIPVQEQQYGRTRPYGIFYEEGNLIHYGATGTHEKLEVTPSQEQKILSVIHLRDATYELLEAEKNGCSQAELAGLQRKLNTLYDDHVNRYGRIRNDKELEKLFREDPSYPLLRSLEVYDGKVFQRKTDLFYKRTIKPDVAPTHADTAEDALKISMQEKGRVDLPYMAGLAGDSTESLVDSLEYTSIYYDAEKKEYQLADEYLSGDIRHKIAFLTEEKAQLSSKLAQKTADLLYPDWNAYAWKPRNGWEQRFLRAAQEGNRIYSYTLRLTDRDYLEEHKEEREFAAMVAGVMDSNAFVVPRFQEDPLFALEAMRYGKPIRRTTKGEQVLRDILQEMDLSKEAMTDIGCGHLTPQSVMAVEFLRERLGEYPADDAAEQKLFLDRLREEWDAYQVEKQNARDALRQDLKQGDMQSMVRQMERLDKNLEALEAVKPKDLTAEEIHATLGTTWIQPEYIQDFLVDTMSLSYSEEEKLDVQYSPVTGKWHIDGKNVSDNAKVNKTYGTEFINALNLCELALNLKQPKVYQTVIEDGEEKRRVDQERTVQAQLKMDDLRQAFEKWLWKDEDRKNSLVDYYNRHFNNIRPREYNGSYLTFPGMAADIQLRPHQKDAIAHTLYGGNTLLAHCVGAGKTYEMVASAMESKRLGIAHKPMIVVPKHLTEQTGAEFMRLYPGAKILVASKKDFEEKNRKEFCAKIATQNWDAVILGYTQFQKIPLSRERQQAILNQQVAELTEELQEARGDAMGKPTFTVKQIEAKRKELVARLTKLEKNEEKDDTITFEELGVDRLYVDEAHYFKNLYTTTKISNVAGVQTSDAQKSTDLYEKCQYLNEVTHGKGIIFATGTPVSNSMTELFTLQRYLQPDRLRQEGLNHFDDWASTFGQTVLSTEISPEGKGFREKTRFAKFYNLPELMSMFKEIADIKTPDMIHLDVPDCEYVVEKLPPSSEQKAMVDKLADRAKLVRDGRVLPQDDNMLKITNEGRKLALDSRILDPELPDNPDSKVNRCVQNVLQIYQDTSEQQSTQLIFCDQSTPNQDGRFNVYDDIRAKLIAQGVKPEEIAYIHDANTDKAKEVLFEKVRQGKVRILLGSTDKMGVGTNVQDRLIATHDLDVPWRPADLEQRRGRIVRQGNQNQRVKVFRYVTEGTFDAYMWQLIENKQRFISQIMTSKAPSREAEDCDELTLSYSEIKACATGNPLIKEKMDVDNDIQRLKMAKSEYLEARADLTEKCQIEYPKQIRMCKEIIERLEDTKMLTDGSVMRDDNGNELFSLELNGKIYTKPSEANAALEKAAAGDLNRVQGHFKGMRFTMVMDYDTNTPNIVLMHKISFRVPVADSRMSVTVRRMEEAIKNLSSKIGYHKEQLVQLEHNLAVAKEELQNPFDKEALLQEKLARSAELEKLLKDDGKPAQEEAYERLARITDCLTENGSIKESFLKAPAQDAAERAFLFMACFQLIRQERQEHPDDFAVAKVAWNEDFDRQCAVHMIQKGIAADQIADTISRLSPSMPDAATVAEEVDTLMRENAACADRDSR